MKAGTQTDGCVFMFILALFTAKDGNNPKVHTLMKTNVAHTYNEIQYNGIQP